MAPNSTAQSPTITGFPSGAIVERGYLDPQAFVGTDIGSVLSATNTPARIRSGMQ
jgi:hypothetical protein